MEGPASDSERVGPIFRVVMAQSFHKFDSMKGLVMFEEGEAEKIRAHNRAMCRN